MAITTTVKNYSKPHGQNGGGGGTTIYRGGSINGSDLPSDLNVTSITAHTGNIDDLTGKTLNYNEGTFLYLYANDGTISKLRGDEIHYTKGKIDELEADKITCNGSLTTKDLYAENGWITQLNSTYITTDYLTVNKQAHFFELIIDKVRSVGGTLMLTQANCVIDYAKALDGNGDYLDDLNDPTAAAYAVFWLARDKNNGTTIDNDWIEGDQAYCQSFKAHAGVNYDVSNKYYWRLVTDVLGDRYMNIKTGAELPSNQAAQASVNTVSINTPKISYELENETIEINKGWNTVAQTIEGVITGAAWDEQSGGALAPTIGTMTTTNTVFGIQMTPVVNSDLSHVVSKNFMMECSPARLNIGIYYTDGTSEFFPAPEVATNQYEFVLKRVYDDELEDYVSTTDAPIEAVVISNADEVEWQLVHGIVLSNSDCDATIVPESSVPSQGDNIVQLGYRWGGSGDSNEKTRGNAIIIAAYKTLDGGTGIQGDFNEYPIAPPSYAQYEAIGSEQGYRYNLAHYRRTFMDANRSVFTGSFYTGSAGNWTNVEDLIDQGEADFFELFIAYSDNPSLGQAGQPAPVVYPNANYNWCKASNMPGGRSWGYMGFSPQPIILEKDPVTGEPTETKDQAMARIEAALNFSEYSWNEVPGGSGTPGGNWVNCYKNTTDKSNAPTPPNVNGVAKHIEELPYDGWYVTPQTLSDGYYTWESQAFVSGSGTYQLWQLPIRITGADGTPGTDGNDIEFIYTTNNGDDDGDPKNPPAPPVGGTYPDDWPSTYDQYGHKINDHETVTNYIDGRYVQTTWYDNPQGIAEDNKYEYVSQRMKRGGIWGDYSAPQVWSSWGRKGTDGDGYEYIFKLSDDRPSTPQAHVPTYDDDVPAGWTDEPRGVSNETGKTKEWVSQRKKYVHEGAVQAEWDPFSTPTLWAQWAPPGGTGPAGPQGPQGETGADGSGYKLIMDNNSYAQYSLSLNAQNEVVTTVDFKLYCRAGKFNDQTTDFLDPVELAAEGLNIYIRLSLATSNSTSTTNFSWFKFKPYTTSTTSANYTLFQFTTTELNDVISNYATGGSIDKQIFVNNNKSIQIALIPSTLERLRENVTSEKNTILNMKDQLQVNLSITSNAQWNVYQDVGGNNSSIAGLVTNMNEQAQVIDQVRIDVNGISETVDRINGDYASKTYVEQNGEEVKLGAINDITGKLWETGIHIDGINRFINLKAEQVIFSNSIPSGQPGHVEGKIRIDPTTGTLYAVDGYFSGEVNATSGNFTGTVNATSGNFTGTVISKNDEMMNEIRIDGPSGFLRMFGPDHVDWNPYTRKWEPTSDAHKYEIFSINFDTDGDTQLRMPVQYLFSKLYSVQIDPNNGIMFGRWAEIEKQHPYEFLQLSKSGIRYTLNSYTGSGSSMSLDQSSVNDVSWKYIIADHNVYNTSTSSIDFNDLKKDGQYVFDIYGIFVFKGNSTATWTIPSPYNYTGKRIVFKSMGAALTITSGNSNNKWFVEYDSNGTFYRRQIECRTREYFSDGEHWIELANS